MLFPAHQWRLNMGWKKNSFLCFSSPWRYYVVWSATDFVKSVYFCIKAAYFQFSFDKCHRIFITKVLLRPSADMCVEFPAGGPILAGVLRVDGGWGGVERVGAGAERTCRGHHFSWGRRPGVKVHGNHPRAHLGNHGHCNARQAQQPETSPGWILKCVW